MAAAGRRGGGGCWQGGGGGHPAELRADADAAQEGAAPAGRRGLGRHGPAAAVLAARLRRRRHGGRDDSERGAGLVQFDAAVAGSVRQVVRVAGIPAGCGRPAVSMKTQVTGTATDHWPRAAAAAPVAPQCPGPGPGGPGVIPGPACASIHDWSEPKAPTSIHLLCHGP